MNRKSMVCLTNTPGEDYGCRLNPYSSSGIYMTSVKEAQWRIVDKNRINQYEVKKNTIRANYFKRVSRIINWGVYSDNIISTVANILSTTKTMEESTYSILQDIITLSSNTLNDAFFHMGGDNSDFTNLKKRTFALDIEKSWGKSNKIFLDEGWAEYEARVVIYRLILLLLYFHETCVPGNILK